MAGIKTTKVSDGTFLYYDEGYQYYTEDVYLCIFFAMVYKDIWKESKE